MPGSATADDKSRSYKVVDLFSFYNKLVKHRILSQKAASSTCVLTFGPSDSNRTRKESNLLSPDLSVNMALKTAKDLLALSS